MWFLPGIDTMTMTKRAIIEYKGELVTALFTNDDYNCVNEELFIHEGI